MTAKHTEIFFVPRGKDKISCDGGGAAGHPRVYYTLGDQEEVVCGYCNRLFTKKQMAGAKSLKEAG